jgi:hypothetical protein
MQHFRDAGATLYDFGGWCAGQDHEDFLRVNRFKEGFGGTVRQEAEGVRALTFLDWPTSAHAGFQPSARRLVNVFEGHRKERRRAHRSWPRGC